MMPSRHAGSVRHPARRAEALLIGRLHFGTDRGDGTGHGPRRFSAMNFSKQPVCPLAPVVLQLLGRPWRLTISNTRAVPAQLPVAAAGFLGSTPRNGLGIR